jgi:Domain of unknown function (DUF1814).
MMSNPDLVTLAGREAFSRIKDIAKEKGQPLHSVALRYVLERFLHRLFSSQDPGVERLFVHPRTNVSLDVSSVTLKGGMTLTFAEQVPVLEGRSTGDADLHLASFGGSMEDYAAILAAGLAGPPASGPDDGVRFDVGAMRVARDREERTGGTLVIPAQVGSLAIQIKTDVSFDARPMHAKAPVVDYPMVLPDAGIPAPVVRRVPYEFMVADKFAAAIAYGIMNKRIRDYPDMRLVLGKGLVDRDFLAETMAATVRFQGRELPETMAEAPAFSDEFARLQSARWETERASRRYVVRESLPEIIAWLREDLEPVLQAARELEDLPAWSSGPR